MQQRNPGQGLHVRVLANIASTIVHEAHEFFDQGFVLNNDKNQNFVAVSPTTTKRWIGDAEQCKLVEALAA